MSQTIARTLPRVARVSRQQIRKYATPAAEHPEGYVPSGEEFIAQRAAVKEHAKGAYLSATRCSQFSDACAYPSRTSL